MRYLTLSFALAFLAFSGFAPARAEVLDGTSCDAAYLDVIKNRGWMEGKREMEIAQTFIRRPDSVLQYSCFYEWQKRAGAHDNLVLHPYVRYMDSNYGFKVAGGQDGVDSNDPLCNIMGRVWQFLKCSNFDTGHFPSLTEMVAGDMRSLPQSCSAKEPNHNQTWGDSIIAANVRAEEFQKLPAAQKADLQSTMNPLQKSAFEENTVSVSALNTLDAFTSSAGLFDPEVCEDAVSVPTGLMLMYVGPNGTNLPRPERICLAPGCYFAFDDDDPEGPGKCLREPPD